jgi:hypothetical protein
MQPSKSRRHQIAANVRWRAAEVRADMERAAGIEDRESWPDNRQPFALPFAALGWRDVRIEPRRGYVAWRCVDAESGEVLACKALGELLRWIAAQVPRRLGWRNFS